MIDVPALVLSVLLVGLSLVVGDFLRAASTGRLWVAPTYRRPLKFEFHVLFGAALLLFLGPVVMGALLGVRDEPKGSLRPLEAQTLAHFLTLALLPAILAASRQNRLTDYGIDCRAWLAEMRYGALGFLASVPAVVAVQIAIAPLRTPESLHPFLRLLEGAGGDRAILEVTFAAVVTAPLAEELIFRVALQGMFGTVLSGFWSVVLPALAFAAVHGRLDMFPLFPLAIALGIVYRKRRSYVAVVTLHSLFNAANLALGLAAHQLS